jgi:lipopolysaccharide transport system permease protein
MATADSKPLTVIEPRSEWSWHVFAELWQYRELLLALASRDIMVRYKQALLGFAWAILQPVTTMVIFTVIFGGLAKMPSDGAPYPVFVFSGLLSWTLFSSAINAAANSTITAANLIRKIYFPRVLIPIGAMGVSLVDYAVAFCLLLLLMAGFGVGFSPALVLVPVIAIGVLVLACGVGFVLSSLIVKYRDFRFVVPFLLQIWMYVTPVIYPLSFVPPEYTWLASLNPMSGYIDASRSLILGTAFSPQWLAYSVAFSLASTVLGFLYYSKTAAEFADII